MDIVEGDDNIIYFYASVDLKENFKLNKELSSWSSNGNGCSQVGHGCTSSYSFKINSYGGSVFGTFGSIDYIMQSKTPFILIRWMCS